MADALSFKGGGVVLPLRTLCFLALENMKGHEAGIAELPGDIKLRLLEFIEFRRRSVYVWPGATNSNNYATSREMVATSFTRLELLWPHPSELLSLFDHVLTPYANLRELSISGILATNMLPLDKILKVCHQVTHLSLVNIAGHCIFSHIEMVSETLESLTLINCRTAFSAPGDSGQFLQTLSRLSVLCLRLTAVTSKMLEALPYLEKLTSLDISETHAHEFLSTARTVSRLTSLETLSVGSCRFLDISQLYIIPSIADQNLPALRQLSVSLPRLPGNGSYCNVTKEHLQPLRTWANSGRNVDLRILVPSKRELSYWHQEPGFSLRNPSFRELDLEQLGESLQDCAWFLHLSQNPPAHVDSAWLHHLYEEACFVMQQFSNWPDRWTLSGRSITLTSLMLMTQILRYASGNPEVEIQLSHDLFFRLVTNLRDAVHVVEKMVPGVDNEHNVVTLVSTVRLLTWLFDLLPSADRLSLTGVLIFVFDLHILISKAIPLAPDCIHAAMVIYGNISSCQPFKLRLLVAIETILISLLNPNEDIPTHLRRACFTVAGNLASNPGNTRRMVEHSPLFLKNLVQLLGDHEQKHGAPYLLGNMSYIEPDLVGLPLLKNGEFRERIAALHCSIFKGQQNGQTATQCFWILWCRCHALGRHNLMQEDWLDEYIGLLSDDVLSFTDRFPPGECPIPCLWTNLIGVKSLLQSRYAFVRAWSYWLLSDIVSQTKHRPKFSSPDLLEMYQMIGKDSAVFDSADNWHALTWQWWEQAMGFLLLDESFVAAMSENAGLLALLRSRRGMRPQIEAGMKMLDEAVRNRNHAYFLM